MRLRVVSRYRSVEVAYEEGQEIDVSDEHAAFLKRDAPGSFAEITEETATGLVVPDRRARGGRIR